MAEGIVPVHEAVLLTNQKELVAQLKTALGENDIVLKSLHGVEKISELFEFRVVFQTKNSGLDQDNALGTSFTVTIKADKEERHINGIVAEFSQNASKGDGSATDVTEYVAVLRPKLWYLTLDKNYLIFHQKSAMDIIKAKLSDGGVTDIEDKTTSCGKTVRNYCVQYGESSFNFISRLMEDEGISYFFKHSDGKHVMVLADSSSAHKPIEGDKKIDFMLGVQTVFPLGVIFNTSMTTAFNTGGYITADYNYTISQTKLYSKLDSKYKKGPKYYEYPGIFEKANEGDNIAKHRVEEFESSHCFMNASSTVPRLSPGCSFEIKGHHCGKFNKEFVVYGVEHIYDFTGQNGYIYMNNFSSFPKGTEFRPPRIAYHPRISGTQTAVVLSNAGDLEPDKFASIKVKFHWDQEDAGTCWVRVMQPTAGKGWGHLFIPRVGQEAVVAFVGGDPDRPVVIGCLYNDDCVVPYTEEQKEFSCIKQWTLDGDKSNELRFNDKADEQEIYVHGEKDVHVNIINSRLTEIEESNDTLQLWKGNRTIELLAQGDDPGNHLTELTRGDKTIHIIEGNQITNLDKGDAETTQTEGDMRYTMTKGNATILMSEGDLSHTMSKGNKTIEMTEGNLSYTMTKGDATITLSEGNVGYTMSKGNATVTLSEGNADVTLTKGNASVTLSEGNATITLANGNLSYDVTGDCSIHVTGKLNIKADDAISIESGSGTKIKAGQALEAESGTDIKMKAGTNLKAEAGVNMELKGGAQAKVAGPMVEIAGQGTVKINGPMITIGGGMLQLG